MKGIFQIPDSSSHSGCGNPSLAGLSPRLSSPFSTALGLFVGAPSHGPDHYADEVNAPSPHSPIPPAALARRARLQATLLDIEEKAPNLEPWPLQALRAGISRNSIPDLDSLVSAIAQEHLEEEASELLRGSRRGRMDQATVEAAASRLAPLAATARQRRAGLWHLDTSRQLVRLSYAKDGPATGFDDGDVHAIFLQAFRLEGLLIALDLAKRPRPLLGPGFPLPSGVGGLAELMDVVFKKEPREHPSSLMDRLNQRLPQGLRINQWQALPAYVSQVSELALLSHWRWQAPAELRAQATARSAAFLAAGAWPWDRGAAKADGQLDLRQLVPELYWEQDHLFFTSCMGTAQAINPLKMLGAILDLEPARIVGLVRAHVVLKDDARLSQAERFEPKLKNMYEDAVLLGGGSNIILVDDDDDEPIHLGPPSETT